MATHYPSDSDDYTAPNTKLFRRQRPIHEALGGGKGTLYCTVLYCFNVVFLKLFNCFHISYSTDHA